MYRNGESDRERESVVTGSVAYHVSAGTRASDSLLSFLPQRIYGSPLSSSGPHPFSNTRLSGERKKICGARGRRVSQATFPGSIGLSGTLDTPSTPSTPQPTRHHLPFLPSYTQLSTDHLTLLPPPRVLCVSVLYA